jgi:hypothetical protein
MFDLFLALKPADPEPVDYPFNAADIAAWDNQLGADRGRIDDVTWADMHMPVYLERLTQGISIFGKQWLYRQLRRGASAVQRNALTQRTAALSGGAARNAREQALRCLRNAETEIATIVFGPETPPPPRWLRWTPLLLAVVPLALLATAFSIVALPGIVLGCLLLILAQASVHQTIVDWYGRLHTMQLMLRAVTLMGDDGRASRLNRQLEKPAAERVPLLNTYSEWLLLSNVRHYVKTHALVVRERAYLRACFERCAQAEADLALARHQSDTAHLCQAAVGGTLDMRGARHPLMAASQPLDVVADGEGIFLSGQNGIGKSTLLRTIGLNVLVARAFGFSYANAATVPDLPVCSSMRNEDSLDGGESQYQAELRRAREMLEAPESVYIIDEIFRGTNPLESVSAAAAVLRQLGRKGVVLASSHHIALAGLLAPGIAARRLEKGPHGLPLVPGVLQDTNGIAMLSERGLPEDVTAEAREIYRQLVGAMLEPATTERRFR